MKPADLQENGEDFTRKRGVSAQTAQKAVKSLGLCRGEPLPAENMQAFGEELVGQAREY